MFWTCNSFISLKVYRYWIDCPFILFYSISLLFKKQNTQNETFVKWEDASKEAYSYALAVAVGMGGVLCIVNGMLLLCICQRSGRRNCSKNNNNYDAGTARDSTIHSTNNR